MRQPVVPCWLRQPGLGWQWQMWQPQRQLLPFAVLRVQTLCCLTLWPGWRILHTFLWLQKLRNDVHATNFFAIFRQKSKLLEFPLECPFQPPNNWSWGDNNVPPHPNCTYRSWRQVSASNPLLISCWRFLDCTLLYSYLWGMGDDDMRFCSLSKL